MRSIHQADLFCPAEVMGVAQLLLFSLNFLQ